MDCSRIRIALLICLVLALASVSAFADTVDNIYTTLNQTNTKLDNIKEYVNSIRSYVIDISSNSSSINSSVSNISTNTNSISSSVSSIYTHLVNYVSHYLNSINNTVSAFASRFETYSSNMYSKMSLGVDTYLHDIHEMIYDPKLKEAKDDYASRSAIVADDFLDSGGSASASLSDFGDAASGLSSLKDGLAGGASSGRAFDVMSGSSDAWSYFSNAVKNDLAGTTSTRKGNSASVYDSAAYPLLSERFNTLSDFLRLENEVDR